MLEQSKELNESFTKLITDKLCLNSLGTLSYHCQDADPEYGRPDIAGYKDGSLKILCEAKFYAGLTPNQPVSYIKRLFGTPDSGVIFICPSDRIKSLWIQLTDLTSEAGLNGKDLSAYCIDCSGTHMSIISWNDILSELEKTVISLHLDMHGDLQQLKGFCSKIESEAFVPFDEDGLSVQAAKNMDRYYVVVDEVISVLKTHKELSPSTNGLRVAPRWQGYTAYISLKDKGVSVNFLRTLWKDPGTITTPFWINLYDIENGKWFCSDRYNRFLASFDSKRIGTFNGMQYIALEVKPYVTLEEIVNDMTKQILEILSKYEQFEA